jgi:ABC-2 type transport system ATP-binding protein
MDILSVEGVRKAFKRDLSLSSREVLHGVSFDAGEREILGFLGPNGAGKTTTIKIMLGLIRADRGEVRIFGRPVGDRTAMARIGYLPENPYFYPHLSLKEFLFFCGRMSGMTDKDIRRRVGDVSRLVGLAEEGGVRLKAFSKGMLQRAGLAQAILHDPDLLILDEPFSGLDPLGRKMVRDILVDLRERGKTIFFSSHILPDMEALCDRTCILREGVIVRCLGLSELSRIGEGKVEVAARNVKKDSISSLADYIDSTIETGLEVVLIVKEQEYVRTVIQHLYNSGAEVLKVVNQAPTLEEIFIDEISRKDEDAQAPDKSHEHTPSEPEVMV